MLATTEIAEEAARGLLVARLPGRMLQYLSNPPPPGLAPTVTVSALRGDHSIVLLLEQAMKTEVLIVNHKRPVSGQSKLHLSHCLLVYPSTIMHIRSTCRIWRGNPRRGRLAIS